MAHRATFPFRSIAFDVSVDGGDVWVASGYGLELLDPATNPPSPRFTLPLPGVTRVIRAANGLAYAASDDRLYVVRRESNALRAVTYVTAKGTINDVALGPNLYLATSKGIEQYDLGNPSSPSRTSVTFSVSNENVQSLAINGTSLYVADGDSTVEVFSIAAPSSPVKTATLNSLPRSIAVHVARDRVYVSDGQNTDVFLGSVRGAQFAYGSTAFATITGDEHFVAGTDRAVRAVDFAVASRPVELFEQQLAPRGGTNNRVFAMQRVRDRLYVAAGDIGLATFDTSGFVHPYGLASYRSGSTSSVAIAGSTAIVAAAGTAPTELSVNASGLSLDVVRTRPGTVDAVHDASATQLLLSKAATLWLEPVSGSAAPVWQAALGSTVRSAAIAGKDVVALLENGTAAVLDTANGARSSLDLGGMKPSLMAAAENGTVVFAAVSEDGNTELRIYGSPSAPAVAATVPGAATAIAAGSAHAAVFTFRGISLVDALTGAVTLLPGSETHLATQLRFAGSDLLLTTDRMLVVWDTTKRRVVQEIALPSEPSAIDAANGIAVLATRDGVTAVRYGTPSLPASSEPRNGSRYYTRVAAGGSRLYLADADSVDLYSTQLDFLPHFLGSIASPGLTGIAASDSALFTLSTAGVVRSWTRDGALLRERTLHDGSSDWQPLSIHTVRGAVWISYSRGCLGSGCERSTAVLDPDSLATSATLSGAVVDLSAAGTRAAALFTSPTELRSYDVSVAAQPVQSAARSVDATAVSVAIGGGAIYVLGPRISVFDAATLAPAGDLLESSSRSATDRVRAAGGCGILAPRLAALELRALPQWTLSSRVETPALIRGLAMEGSRAFVLTDQSVEVLDSATSAPSASRRRAAK